MVRYARWDLLAVELIDPRSLTPLSPLYTLNKTANFIRGFFRYICGHTENRDLSISLILYVCSYFSVPNFLVASFTGK